MLPDLAAFFDDVSSAGAIFLLFVGLLTGFGLHDLIVNLWSMFTQWYAAEHGQPR